MLTHPAATGSYGCSHWRSKLEQEKVKVDSQANQEAAYERVDDAIKNIKD